MKVAIIGMGSVGRGVAGMIAEKDIGMTVTAVADSKSGIASPGGIDIKKVLAGKKKTGMCGDPGLTASDIVKKADYDVLVEVSPTDAVTGEPALSYMKGAIMRKKHVVTSNKGPVALAYRELNALAAKKKVMVRHEATVAGAIPVFHVLEHGLAGNEIRAVYGVLNGTCNYILTRMAAEGLTYEQSLLEAR